MTFFHELDNEQKDYIKDVAIISLNRRIADDTKYTDNVFKLILLANATAIFLIIAYATKSYPLSELAAPLWKYIVGLISIASINIIFLSVAVQATIVQSEEWLSFYLNNLELNDIKGWSLNKHGLRVVYLLTAISLFFFIYGTFQIISIISIPSSCG
jgi:hypothetical protein